MKNLNIGDRVKINYCQNNSTIDVLKTGIIVTACQSQRKTLVYGVLYDGASVNGQIGGFYADIFLKKESVGKYNKRDKFGRFTK